MPADFKPSTMCSRIGLPCTLSIGFGSALVNSRIRVPFPAARMTAFTSTTPALCHQSHSTAVYRCRFVIASGGGLGANPEHLISLKQHALVVCLWASTDVIWERVRSQSHRPLLQGGDPMEKIRELLAAREPFYRQADVLIGTGMRSIKE